MAAISLGLDWNPQTGAMRRRVAYALNRHIICFGPTRSGKGVCLEIPNLLRLGSGGRDNEPLSIISIDPKGQNAAVTARWRSRVSDVVFINPLNLLGLGSSGFNPLARARLDPASPHFFLHASAIAEALVRLAESGDPFWNISARNLVLALVMWEVKVARAEGRMPLLRHVRGMMTGDLSAVASRIVASGDFQLASLAGIVLRMRDRCGWLCPDS
jgi:type IV secretion system protein VirD4